MWAEGSIPAREALEPWSSDEVSSALATFETNASLVSSDHGMDVPLIKVEREQFLAAIETAVKDTEISRTARDVAELTFEAPGACSFAIAADRRSFERLKHKQNIAIHRVDRSADFPDGYVHTRLRDLDAKNSEFRNVVCEMSEHTDDDCWPEGHEAAGLPKDGFILLDRWGRRVVAACRISGCPNPPYCWDRVGTRRWTGLSLAWCLRYESSIVIVRSSSDKVYAIVATRDDVEIFWCHA